MNMFSRKCPSCPRELFYKTQKRCNFSESIQTECKSCIKKGIRNPNYKEVYIPDNVYFKDGVWNVPCLECSFIIKYKNKHDAIKASIKKRICKSCRFKGDRNPCYGRNQTGSNNPMYKKSWRRTMLEKYGFDEYMRIIDARTYKWFLSKFGIEKGKYFYKKEFKNYLGKVNKFTKSQPLHLLENFNKRGRSENGGFHVDHIFSILKGYIYNIPIELIGHIANLRMIYGPENSSKNVKIIEIPIHIMDYIQKNKIQLNDADLDTIKSHIYT